MEDDLLEVITVATTGSVCFIIALNLGLLHLPALLCGVVGSAAQAALSRGWYPPERCCTATHTHASSNKGVGKPKQASSVGEK
jgi:hypothetical protein